MSTVEKSIDVDVPVSTAYNQWTQFESFPQFMEGVDRIDQTSDRMTHWVTSIGGVTREFDAQITEQHPDERHRVDVGGRARRTPAWSPSTGSTRARPGSCCRWTTARGCGRERGRQAGHRGPPGRG